MGPCNEVVFLGGVERQGKEQNHSWWGGGGLPCRGGRGLPGGPCWAGGQAGAPESCLLCVLSVGQRVPLCSLVAVQLREGCV